MKVEKQIARLEQFAGWVHGSKMRLHPNLPQSLCTFTIRGHERPNT
ncbi:hypothetical protein KEJ34_05270 [Candidatus Bathyarchaeota archaeon]|nr:hypothetical protein [Candidatus Bathyarchaeota archaeon]